jgi:hypothetical protein
LAFRADLQQLLYAFAPDAVTLSTAIPYSWQVSQIKLAANRETQKEIPV